MKKAFIAILAIIYLGITSGVVINLHYCMGKVASVEYGFVENKPCSVCGMESKHGCCHDEYKVVKLDDSHQASKANHDFLKSPVSLPERHFVAPAFALLQNTHHFTPHHSPPDPDHNPLYLLNQVFRI